MRISVSPRMCIIRGRVEIEQGSCHHLIVAYGPFYERSTVWRGVQVSDLEHPLNDIEHIVERSW
ncbi:MAG: hypothetical protein AAFQ82_04160 [Myxococcota bacterium]